MGQQKKAQISKDTWISQGGNDIQENQDDKSWLVSPIPGDVDTTNSSVASSNSPNLGDYFSIQFTKLLSDRLSSKYCERWNHSN